MYTVIRARQEGISNEKTAGDEVHGGGAREGEQEGVALCDTEMRSV